VGERIVSVHKISLNATTVRPRQPVSLETEKIKTSSFKELVL
jgi:hypothetical protein